MNDSTPRFCPERGLVPALARASEALPASQFQWASRRLTLLAAALAAAACVGLVAGALVHEVRAVAAPVAVWLDREQLVALIVVSLATIAVLRWGRPSLGRVADVGSAFQVLGALLLSLTSFGREGIVLQDTPSRLTWLGVWIVLFPLFAPAPPARIAVQALASAATAPLVFAAATLARGATWPDLHLLVGTFLPYPVCAALSLVPSVVLARMSRDLRAARAEARVLGQYRLLERIGSGGMGEVWRAEHRLLARPAAVKLIHPQAEGFALEEALARFEREAWSTARLRSPHTVSLYDYGVAEDGTAYYAMELLEGVDLEDLVVQHGTLTPGRAIHLIMQAAESLAEAHAAGLVHRDIKPANLFVARLGVSVDVLKVMDFGLVALGSPSRPGRRAARLTNPDLVVGTPAYMAPEQAFGDGGVDARTDIYALGCVLYWLLSGEPVFQDSSPVHVLLAHARARPRPLRARIPAVPADLEDVVLACLAKSPADRPQTALELRDRLAACAAARTWTSARAQAWWARHMPQVEKEPVEAVPSERLRRARASTRHLPWPVTGSWATRWSDA